MKLCKDCKHYQLPERYTEYRSGAGLMNGHSTVTIVEGCRAPGRAIDPVDGWVTPPREQRFFGPCGIEGKLWEAL